MSGQVADLSWRLRAIAIHCNAIITLDSVLGRPPDRSVRSLLDRIYLLTAQAFGICQSLYGKFIGFYG